MQTLSEENYLKLIYHLSEGDTHRIATSAVAAGLGVSAASVTEKLQRLAEKKLIEYEKSKGVRLTKAGNAIAIKVIRKHRIWETFLVHNLGFGWEEVHDIAEQLEHIQSDKLIERIEKHLGYPRFDPHGEPIPDAKGKVNQSCFTHLHEMPAGIHCRITGVKEDGAAFLQLFKKLGLSLGDKLRIQAVEKYDQSRYVQVNDKKELHLSQSICQNILITVHARCCALDSGVKVCPIGKS